MNCLTWAAGLTLCVAGASLTQGQGITVAAADKRYDVAAAEVIGFNVLLNVFDRLLLGPEFDTDFATIRRNLRRAWVVEDDPYAINQFGHPYQGSMYHGFARSAGLNFWESLGYAVAGSVIWEIAGETTPPSRNDLIASGVAGSFLGESFIRIASLLLENAPGAPGVRRRLAAAAISPSRAFNRRVLGSSGALSVPSRGASYYRRLQLGAAGTLQSRRGASTSLRPNEAVLDVSMEYGLPGPTAYAYTRPFDYFTVQATASSAHGFETILTRGLLAGRPHSIGDEYRAVWGLYGSYDYIAPQLFRVSSTALSLGTTLQWGVSPQVTIQGTALAGAGFAAAGTIHGVREGDYHYGIAPQGLLAARAIAGSRASLDLTLREYYVSDVPASSTAGHDNIARAEAALTVRLSGQRALALKYVWSRRDAQYPELGRRTQVRGTLGVFYTWLGHDRFGVVDQP